MKYDALGIRMKGYEHVEKRELTRRMPTIIRIDGCHFHSYTKRMEKPFDRDLFDAMIKTSIELCKNISGAKLAYTQSDEISILLTDYDNLDTQPWFGKSVQKLASVSASIATAAFNRDIIS